MTLDEYRELRKKTPIMSAIVNTTDACNLRCKYCFTAQNGRIAPPDLGKDVIHFLVNERERTGTNGEILFAFFGGEPMLRYDEFVKPTILWAKDAGIAVNFSITTNGTLLTEERLAFLKENDCGILLSIDGDKRTQDDQRPAAGGKSSFDLIDIPLILRYYPQVTFRSTLEPRNSDKIFENYLFARNSGFQSIFFCPNSYANWTEKSLDVAMEQLSACVYLMVGELIENKNPLLLESFRQVFRQCFHSFDKKEMINDVKSPTRCGLGMKGIGVKTTGEINGCQEHNTYYEDDIFLIGDIYNGINEERHLRLINEYMENDTKCQSKDGRCDFCEYRQMCVASGGCPSQNLGSGGKMNMISEGTCSLFRFQMGLSKVILEMLSRLGNDTFNRVTDILLGRGLE